MAETPQQDPKRKKLQFTLDGWAVFTALALALLVRLGLIHKVPW